ncbi:biotin/lipoyl-binding protein [Proteus mirabilis]|uniref:Biotin/lipoyl-binding protein n=1 Tax=Proteus mirabilis TaxID=584 RepID=A0ABD5LZQ7_PROMI
MITLILLWQSIHISALNPLSEDAIIDANKINISASVPGRIAAVYVKENSKVKKAIYCLHLIPQCTHSG